MIIIMSVLSVLYYSNILASPNQEDTGKAIKEFESGVRSYKSKEYKVALSKFIKSLRFAQDHQTLYYKALTISKLDRPCEDLTSAWRNYIDYCKLDKRSNCTQSWLQRAQERHSVASKKCTISEPRTKQRAQSTQRAKATTSLTLTTSMVCRIKKERGGFEQLKVCNGEYLQEDDQIRLEASSKQGGYLYIILLTDRGQIQLVYPEGNQPNQLNAHQKLRLPNDPYYKGWWPVDNIKNDKERIILILTSKPDTDLEAMRGVNLSPAQARSFLNSTPSVKQAMAKWSEIGASSEGDSENIVIQSTGTSNRVVIQYYFQHE